MKTYRNATAALVLALALSSSAFAGVMQTGVTGTDPQPTSAANGEMQTGATDGETHAGADTVTAAVLNLPQSMFTLL